jgi:nitrogenase molybdenum-iron protein beta chain
VLDPTPKEVVDRAALRINPLAACQPLGAIYASLGIHACLPHSHGSSGCSRYQKSLLENHFRKPIRITTSVLKESAAIFGGEKNLKTAIQNIFDHYDPEIIAVHSTCLSETIGDDLKACLYDIPVPEGKYVIHANTPSYAGSHITGFSNMVASAIEYLAEAKGQPNGKVGLIPGFVNPGDMREIKRISGLMGVKHIMFPDTCGVFGQRAVEKMDDYPAGGTRVADIIDLGNCTTTLALGKYSSEAGAIELERKCGVPFELLDLPIGVEGTDSLVMRLRELSGQDVAVDLEEEREQAIDVILDAHPFFYGKKVAIFGDPDIVVALAEFVASIGMIPKYVITGTPGSYFVDRIRQIFAKYKIDGVAKDTADLFALQQWIRSDPVDLIVGGTHAKLLARAEDVPFVRAGFPIMDRHVQSQLPTVGYRGAIRLLDLILNALMDRLDRDSPEYDLLFL